MAINASSGTLNRLF